MKGLGNMLKIRDFYINGTRLTHNGADDTSSICDISAANPYFSWSVDSDRAGGKQGFFRISFLQNGRVLYDSGRVIGDTQSFFSADICFPRGKTVTVKLTVASDSGDIAKEYENSFFIANIEKSEGQLIAAATDAGKRTVIFKKEIRIEKELCDATVYYCGLGYSGMEINGERISRARMDPAFTNYSRICLYRVIPEAQKLFRDGKNTVTVKVAPGWRNNDPDGLGRLIPDRLTFVGESVLWACIKLAYTDGTTETVSTDASWEYALGAQIYSDIFRGESFDARLNLPLNELEWRHVKISDARLGDFRPMTLQPILEQEVYSPVEITMPSDGIYVVDFGKNIAGVPRLFLPRDMNNGQTVTLRCAEELDEDGGLFVEPLRKALQTDTYTASGDGRDLDVWQPEFTYHGFRYCEVSGIPCLDPDMIEAVSLYTNIKSRSSFCCGSPAVNAIQEILLQTEKNNMHGILTDCPQRDERMGWLNDSTVRFEETPYNFDASRIFPKIVDDIRAEQSDGMIGCTAPFMYGSRPADSVSSSFLVAVKEALMHYGNLPLADDAFDALAAWEDYLLSRSPDGTVEYSYYGDWAAPAYACISLEDAKSAVTDGRLMSTGYSYYNCKLLADIAGRTGRADAKEKYSQAARRVRDAFLEKWFDRSSCRVGSGSMGAQAFALWLGILPKECEAGAASLMVKDIRERNYKFTTGNLNTRYMTDMLAKHGYIDDAWKLLTRDEYPSFGYMLQNEATTVWERFELKKDPSMNSHDHPMYGAVGYFLYAYLGGIIPTSPSFKTVSIKPYFPSGLLSAHAVVDSVMGEISVRWAKRYGKLYLFVNIPFGVKASIDFDGKVTEVGGGHHTLQADTDVDPTPWVEK